MGKNNVPGLGILIFDMDGTIVDSMSLYTATFAQILSHKHEIPTELSTREYINSAGQPLDEQLSRILLMNGIRQADIESLVADFWAEISRSKALLFPGVSDTLTVLKQAGYALILSTGSPPSIMGTKMKSAEIDGYFDLMLGTDYENPGLRKGENHFEIVRNKYSISLEELRLNTILVGDGQQDMRIAGGSGILAVGKVTGGNGHLLRKAGAKLLIDEFCEVVAVLRSSVNEFSPISQVIERYMVAE